MGKVMKISELCDLFFNKEKVDALRAALNSKRRVVMVDGLAGSSVAMMVSRLPKRAAPYIVVATDADDAGYLYFDLTQIVGEQKALFFPSAYRRGIKYGQIDPPQQILRTEVLSKIVQGGEMQFIVTYPDAIAEQVAKANEVQNSTLSFSKDTECDLTATVKQLIEFGFSEVDYVYEPGQFAVRGGILDVYSFSNENPYRIEFFGDDIESIRTFNIETQLSIDTLTEAFVVSGSNSTIASGVSLLEYSEDSILVCADFRDMLARVRQIADEGMSESALIAAECDCAAISKVVNPDLFAQQAESRRRVEYKIGGSVLPCDEKVSFDFTPQGVYHKDFDLIADSFRSFLAQGFTIHILSDSPKQIERLRLIFEDREDDIVFTAVSGTLHGGFVDKSLGLCAFTDHQIFDRFHKYNLKSDRARSGKLALSLKELKELEVGDFVVHIDFGIGKFGGLVRQTQNGITREMIKIVYQKGDLVLMSIHSLHKIAKYRGKEGVPPRLSTLGGHAWENLKERTKSKLKDIARDLIKLYSARKEEQGFAFSPDCFMQQELEASFIYEDTPDQLTATNAVKADMESNRPMDRLICGDVGFGKTEIAVRAAFKAACDNKQVAVLVPTTVLAYQHFRTFSERLKDFPVRVEYLSRARSPKKTKEILADLASGKVNIIIGTHKLIGKAVQFKDLGLLVVDEEQKFGVAVKEKLKQMKVNVDTLTMSATPIPRTLQFSLMGARDLSNISTPPPNRYPIITTVSNLDNDIIAEAINFELSRNGQVFFVSNRIDTLPGMKERIQSLVPDARIAVGHGQMDPEKLEKLIIDFANHDYDILLSTSIIESGIDMPNVNTIIINEANKFGLSDLHQLRGRVGRSSRKAFCYLFVNSRAALSDDAKRRLQAIESFSDLGSGIHIAMQDLDIRGAGNLLGAEQSGFIADLGYETYQKVLKQAVLELKTEEFSDTFDDDMPNTDAQPTEFVADCVVETDLAAMFPALYVPQERERIMLYHELDNMEREEDVAEFRRNLRDRFGKIPEPGEELICIVSLRREAKALGIQRIILKQGAMRLRFVGRENKAYYESRAFDKILNYINAHSRSCNFSTDETRPMMIVKDVHTIRAALDILLEMRNS